ncbi:MAG: alpha-glucosidase, partial [Oscillospiraceae bacterium]|nr:alpha-glucosidase [Oscillospiraceae bacterium]
MIQKYIFGSPFPTDAVITEIPAAAGAPDIGKISLQEGFRFIYALQPEDAVYGLGGANRGINKRGFVYVSDCSDNPNHHEDVRSLYAAHNFLLISGKTLRGLFFDYPSFLTFDVGYTRSDTLQISCDHADLALYVISGNSELDIVHQFRSIIGQSYIPPKFAFGFGQSRWGYKTPDDFRKVASEHRKAGVGLDMVYMDIDYMDAYKDFTVNTELYPDFAAFVKEMKEEQGVRLIPIIDAGVKIEAGYPIYEEGLAGDYFCKKADGTPFQASVWPGYTHFPDVLNPEARRWFGDHYRFLVDQGIDGFWNDMNEPSIFHSPEGMQDALKMLNSIVEAGNIEVPMFEVMDSLASLSNSHADYARFFHQVDGKPVCHERVHNLFGYNMTRAAGEAFERIAPEKRFLMFSRSSYVGMHRYGGIWTGDNKSWWSHLLLNLKMLPSLNMCGFLYIGADLGGFGCDTTRDLLLRWLALGVFTPLMRNHATNGSREQEFYQFEGPQDFAHVIGVRYRLLPYLYSTYIRCALENEMMFKPLAFVYPDDEIARNTEDQLMLGDEIMIAPVYTQNAEGRTVYLPEEMLFIKFLPNGSIHQQKLAKGLHYVKVALNEVPLFIRSGRCIPVAEAAQRAEDVDFAQVQLLGWPGASFALYNDDGFTKNYS